MLRSLLADTPLDRLLYYVRRNRWMVSPRTYLGDFSDVPVEGPIFLLGVQGGGLTLISRVLRRHPDAVSVTGNSSYWSGADEMHTVLGPILPPELTGIRHKPPEPDHPRFPPPRSWTYATDELIDAYRLTREDATDDLRRELLDVLRMTIGRHRREETTSPRFVDKSQVYTVRVGLLSELLEGHCPRFILVPMNPFAAVYKSALGRAADMRRLKGRLSLETRLELCAQHWSNSYRAALDDGDETRLFTMRFEDFLEEPESWMRAVCEFVGLEYHPGMLPRADQEIPLGSRFRSRWYPLRPSRGNRWIARLRDEMGARGIEIIEERCGLLAREFGYEIPSCEGETVNRAG